MIYQVLRSAYLPLRLRRQSILTQLGWNWDKAPAGCPSTQTLCILFITLYTVEGHQRGADVDFYSQVESLKTCIPIRTGAKLQNPMGDWKEIQMGLSWKKVRTKQMFNKWINEWMKVAFIFWHLYLALKSLEYKRVFFFFKRVYFFN